ncbi:hypothetical protein B4U80_11373 [Leptotrombidium deliense]|uniref:tryptophan--tRNA ligase n=1 Tax=Leptotrombidium deliense TaxID=299467 RepID=A0A443SBZ6_9ACAR|nr:hypothetical protein B4U80_11373 [Leptotrombidium deliense]
MLILKRFKLCHHLRSIRYLSSERKVVFSGIQPTGSIHLGNYFGAIQQWIRFQNDPSRHCIFSVVDLHSITLTQEPEKLRQHIRLLVASLLACGIDAEKCILFQQSSVTEHALLCWVLGCLTTMSKLSFLPQYREKSANLKSIPFGIYVYPVLQTADIILYKSDEVPVGDDQWPHLNYARELTEKFNYKFGKIFPIPKAIIDKDSHSKRIKSLRNPEKKMSKSDSDPKSRINLDDDSDAIRGKVMKAVTDHNSRVTFNLEERPGVSNLLILHSLTSGVPIDKICEESSHLTTAEYKQVVAECIIEHLTPIRKKLIEVLDDKLYVEEILRKGSLKANQIATTTMDEVKKAIGFSII